MLTILLVVVLLMLLGAIPSWPHSRGWGYYPSGSLGLVLLVLVVLMLSGRLGRSNHRETARQVGEAPVVVRPPQEEQDVT